jgi:hypothetical protein
MLVDPDSLLEADGEVLSEPVMLWVADSETVCDAEAVMLVDPDSLLEALAD